MTTYQDIVISGTGLYTPPEKISTRELVDSYNAYVRRFNDTHREDIDTGARTPLPESSEAFIVKASGIKSRYVMDKSGILDIDRMHPRIPERSDDELTVQAEMAVAAVEDALRNAGKSAADVDAVITSCSSFQRAYPAIAIEVQTALGIDGYAFDMNVACSAATFALKTAVDAVASGSAGCVVAVNPEINTGHSNFRDRDSHFIFGDVATAMVIERAGTCRTPEPFEILGTRLFSKFSSNVRNNFGYLNRPDYAGIDDRDRLFYQHGRRVFKDIVPLASRLIIEHLAELDLTPDDVQRLWLHQANININNLVAEKILGRPPQNGDAPLVLDEFGNTASAGSIIAFHKYHSDLKPGDIGVLCSFGAGYSAGSIILRKASDS